MTTSVAPDSGAVARALRTERQRAVRFSGWVSASWLVIFVGLVFLFSGIRFDIGFIHLKTISLDFAFIVKWLPFVSGYTDTVSFFVPAGLALLLTGSLVGLRESSRLRLTAALGISLAGAALIVSGGLLLSNPQIVRWLPQQGLETVGVRPSGARLAFLGALMALPAPALFFTRRQAWHRSVAVSLIILGGMALTLGISLQTLHAQDEAVWTFAVPLPYLDALGTTIGVSVLSILCAVVLALLGALGRLSKFPLFYALSTFYISLIRGTPLVVQVFFVFLALPQVGIVLDPIPSGIIALSVNYGAYMTEIFRAGIQAVGRGQTEAALALGFTPAQTLRYIILPQAFRIIIPDVGNQFIAMMKDSALVSFMGVWELLFRAQKVGRQYFHSFEMLLIAAAFYWILTIIFSAFQDRLEKHMARGERKD